MTVGQALQVLGAVAVLAIIAEWVNLLIGAVTVAIVLVLIAGIHVWADRACAEIKRRWDEA